MCPRATGAVAGSVFRRPRHSAASSNDRSGFVVVTHPFHPLNGRRLEVLFVKRRGDAVVFVCSGGLGGQMTLPLAWTDRGEAPVAYRLCVDGLAALDTLVKMLENR